MNQFPNPHQEILIFEKRPEQSLLEPFVLRSCLFQVIQEDFDKNSRRIRRDSKTLKTEFDQTLSVGAGARGGASHACVER